MQICVGRALPPPNKVKNRCGEGHNQPPAPADQLRQFKGILHAVCRHRCHGRGFGHEEVFQAGAAHHAGHAGVQPAQPVQHRLRPGASAGRRRHRRRRLRLRRRAVLHRLRHLRTAQQRHDGEVRCQGLAGPDHGQLGHRLLPDGVRAERDDVLRPAVPPGRRRSRLLPRRHLLLRPLGARPASAARRRPIFIAGSSVAAALSGPDRRTAAQPARRPGPPRLAVAVRLRRRALRRRRHRRVLPP